MPSSRKIVELTAEDEAILSAATSGRTAQAVLVEVAEGIKVGVSEARTLRQGKEVTAEAAHELKSALLARESALGRLPEGETRNRHIGEVRRGIALADEVLTILS